MTQTVKAFAEAEAHPGPSLIIAYSPCIAHGLDMADQMAHQKVAAETGYWPLYRYAPTSDDEGHPFHLDSRAPSRPFREFAMSEARFAMLARANPAESARLIAQAQADIDERWRLYSQMVDVERSVPIVDEIEEPEPGEPEDEEVPA